MKERNEINLTYFEGIDSYIKEMPVIVRIDDTNQRVTIMATMKNKPVIHIKFDQLIDCATISDKTIIEKDKSVIGRAVIGGILTGGLGAIVGGMSGLGSKKKVKETHYLVINYRSKDGEIKVLSFKVNWLILTAEFRDTLRSKFNKNTSVMTETYL